MTCVYIKPEVKENDTAAMTTATNETCIGWLHENCCLMGERIKLFIAEDVNLLRK